jgi:hypothetical protein
VRGKIPHPSQGPRLERMPSRRQQRRLERKAEHMPRRPSTQHALARARLWQARTKRAQQQACSLPQPHHLQPTRLPLAPTVAPLRSCLQHAHPQRPQRCVSFADDMAPAHPATPAHTQPPSLPPQVAVATKELLLAHNAAPQLTRAPPFTPGTLVRDLLALQLLLIYLLLSLLWSGTYSATTRTPPIGMPIMGPMEEAAVFAAPAFFAPQWGSEYALVISRSPPTNTSAGAGTYVLAPASAS